MTKFNKNSTLSRKEKLENSKTFNQAGGKAYKHTAEYEFVNFVMNSMLKGSYYEKLDSELSRIYNIMDKCDPYFLAQTILYARHIGGMRSVSHLLAAKMASKVSGKKWGASFYEKFSRFPLTKSKLQGRPDDMLEILAAYKALFAKDKNKIKLPNAMKKGFANAISLFDTYQLAKYKSENKEVRLKDLIALCHPKPKNSKGKWVQVSIDKFIKSGGKLKANLVKKISTDSIELHPYTALYYGLLTNTDTWESKLSKAGKAGNKHKVKEAKKDAWEEMILEKKIGYKALLMNLLNIAENVGDEAFDQAVSMLKSKKFIEKSLILPQEYLAAYYEIKSKNDINISSRNSDLLDAINKAINISCMNIEIPNAKNNNFVIAIDISSSMRWCNYGTLGKRQFNALHIASFFGAVIANAILNSGGNVQILSYNNTTKNISNLFKKNDVMSFVDSLSTSGGTDASSIFDYVDRFDYLDKRNKGKYKNFIFFTDEQSWGGNDTAYEAYKKFVKSKNLNFKDCSLYTVDVSTSGNSQSVNFDKPNVFHVSGLSLNNLKVVFEAFSKNSSKKIYQMIEEIRKIKI